MVDFEGRAKEAVPRGLIKVKSQKRGVRNGGSVLTGCCEGLPSVNKVAERPLGLSR